MIETVCGDVGIAGYNIFGVYVGYISHESRPMHPGGMVDW